MKRRDFIGLIGGAVAACPFSQGSFAQRARALSAAPQGQSILQFEIDDKLERGRRPHGKVGGSFTAKDAMHVKSGAFVLLDKIDAV